MSGQPTSLALLPGPLADLAAAFDAAGAEEACGVLLGRTRDGAVVVERVVPARNAFAGPGGFAIPDSELSRARLAARRWALDTVGIYHSHPSGRVALSPADRESLVRSSLPWLVIARDGDSARRPALKLVAYAAWTGEPLPVEQSPRPPE